MVRFDCHVHTVRSHDAIITTRQIERALHGKVDVIAVTDHNSITMALEARRLFGVRIIIGEEINTGEGEVVGLFLDERIKPGRGLERTLKEIKAQGGFSYLPHLFDDRRRAQTDVVMVNNLLNLVDAVEVFNARTTYRANEKAVNYANGRGLLMCAGSDAHVFYEIGRGVTILDEIPRDAEHLRHLFRKARLQGRCIHLIERVVSKVLRVCCGALARESACS